MEKGKYVGLVYNKHNVAQVEDQGEDEGRVRNSVAQFPFGILISQVPAGLVFEVWDGRTWRESGSWPTE